MTDKPPHMQKAVGHWRDIERQAKPWQQKQRESRYNPETAIGPPPWTGATTRESSAPSSPALAGISDEEYARRAAKWRKHNRATQRFHDIAL